ncbi:MAG: formylglycine-generating enzyme family protein [Azoarcus sp.]|jgi:formylglycine-generating enzyme required for sulfatase activity|nr:formylglycine-generating enzyme family protein [Azoarcus sp.]
MNSPFRNVLILMPCALLLAACSATDPDAATLVNTIDMEFVLIPSGSFPMGCDSDEKGCDDDESPRHQVTISQPFYLGKHEVTQAQWVKVMGHNPSYFEGYDKPVERVSWNEIQIFIERLNRKEGTDKYRLPTEAEWEYAARAGTTSAYSFGNDVGQADQYVWHNGNSGEQTHPVGHKQPNSWGLYDMHGNVYEWVQDWYDENYYALGAATDPSGPAEGSRRVLRGSVWCDGMENLRSAHRNHDSPDFQSENYGFRLARAHTHTE